MVPRQNVPRLRRGVFFYGKKPNQALGRGHRVTITEAGKDLRRRMWPVYAAAIDRSIAVHLTENEAATLGELLEKLIARRRG